MFQLQARSCTMQQLLHETGCGVGRKWGWEESWLEIEGDKLVPRNQGTMLHLQWRVFHSLLGVLDMPELVLVWQMRQYTHTQGSSAPLPLFHSTWTAFDYLINYSPYLCYLSHPFYHLIAISISLFFRKWANFHCLCDVVKLRWTYWRKS